MQLCQQTAGFLILILLFLWQPRRADQAQGMQEQPLDPVLGPGPGWLPPSRPEKSTTDLVAEMLLLNKLASLENDVFETKTKRSFAGFGGRLDRLSKGLRTKQRKSCRCQRSGLGSPWTGSEGTA